MPLKSSLIARSCCALVLLITAGCGSDDGLPKRLPVSGTVSYKGEPLAQGSINFVPENLGDGRGASGLIENGRFRMTTVNPNDGVIPGTYKVTVTSIEGVDLTDAANQSGPGAMDQAMVAEAYQKATSNIPERYGDPVQTDLEAEVKRGSTKFDFDLSD